MNKAAFFDIDGTLTSENVWKGLMGYFKAHHSRQLLHVFFLAIHFPIYLLNKTGIVREGVFREIWASHLPWYFRKYSVEDADEIWHWVVYDFLKPYWRKDVLEKMKQHFEAGDYVVLVSAGPLPLVQKIADFLDADLAVGTAVDIVDGQFTGKIIPPVCIDEEKVRLALKRLKARNIHVDLTQSFAYADSKTDIPLLKMVGNPVAVYPSADLEEVALRENWLILR